MAIALAAIATPLGAIGMAAVGQGAQCAMSCWLHGGSFLEGLGEGLLGAGVGALSGGIGGAYGSMKGLADVPAWLTTAAAQGTVEGAYAASRGGNFLSSFLAGTFGAATSPAVGRLPAEGTLEIVGKTALALGSGGVGSLIGGGKFEDGVANGIVLRIVAPGLAAEARKLTAKESLALTRVREESGRPAGGPDALKARVMEGTLTLWQDSKTAVTLGETVYYAYGKTMGELHARHEFWHIWQDLEGRAVALDSLWSQLTMENPYDYGSLRELNISPADMNVEAQADWLRDFGPWWRK
ncbi:MAG: hypothetical protein JNM10_12820 [Planctomycetia bacterium]|nr:hypothetical protein [Planctomycetia bacterium]